MSFFAKLAVILFIHTIVFLGLFLIIDYFFKKYKFKNRVLNCLIVLNSIFSNPFNIFVSYTVCLFAFMPIFLKMNYFWKLFLFFTYIGLCTFLKFLFWKFIRRNKKFELSLMLEFSKRYVFHFFFIFNLPMICAENFIIMRDFLFSGLVFYILFAEVLLCSFYMFFSNKYILKPNFLNKLIKTIKKKNK